MRTYRVDSKTIHIEASDDAESIVLEVVRTGVARSRADRNDPPLINSSYARAMRTGPGRSSSSSQAASVAAGPGTSEAAAAGIRRHRIRLYDLKRPAPLLACSGPSKDGAKGEAMPKKSSNTGRASSDPTELERAIRACRSAFAACAMFSLAINVLMLALPVYMLQVYDRVLTTGRVETLVML